MQKLLESFFFNRSKGSEKKRSDFGTTPDHVTFGLELQLGL